MAVGSNGTVPSADGQKLDLLLAAVGRLEDAISAHQSALEEIRLEVASMRGRLDTCLADMARVDTRTKALVGIDRAVVDDVARLHQVAIRLEQAVGDLEARVRLLAAPARRDAG